MDKIEYESSSLKKKTYTYEGLSLSDLPPLRRVVDV